MSHTSYINMNIFKGLLIALLQINFSIAKSSVDNRFRNFYSKSLVSAPLKLDDSTYYKVTAAPRDYSVAVLLTAIDPRFGCQLCRDFEPEWNLLSKSWTRGDKIGESGLIFGTLDFIEGRSIFQALGLQTAPVLLLFHPTQGAYAVSDESPIRFDFTAGPHSAEKTHAWLARHLSHRPHPPVVRPINWSRVATISTTTFTILTFVSFAWKYLFPIFQSRNLWAAISLLSILLLTSGHMFNHIRNVPYVSGDGKGGISYFAGGFSNQFGLETQIIAAMYALLSFATISIALKVPRVLDPNVQQFAALTWCIVVFLVYSLLLSVFRIKNGAYPFWLPPFS